MNLEEYEFTPPVGRPKEEQAETDEERTRKKARESPLHEYHVAPLSFLVDALQASNGFNVTRTRAPFGNNKEAYVRECYNDISDDIFRIWKERRMAWEGKKRAMLFTISGSSGIGKSTFLSFWITRMKQFFPTIAICYAPKSAKTKNGTPTSDVVKCVIWKDGKIDVDGTYRIVEEELESQLPNLDLIVMDGCSMQFVDVEVFKGVVIVAALPSLYVKNLKDAIFWHYDFTMPPIEDEEAFEIAGMLGIPNDIINENLAHMKGIARYLFDKDAAKTKVHEALKEVNATSITSMVSMQATSRDEEANAVHALVLWKVTGKQYRESPRYELASRYIEKLVAQKLATESTQALKLARINLKPLSGAEGYADALFEAYAIRTIQGGGVFAMRCLDGSEEDIALHIPTVVADPVIAEANTLTNDVVPYSDVRVVEGEGKITKYSPRLLWPTTTDFPTFDCFYFHTNGSVFPLQMTVALTHDLRNSGAAATKKYLDAMLGSNKPAKYPAVFVVPADNARRYQQQQFKGTVNKKTVDLAPHFSQWVTGIEYYLMNSHVSTGHQKLYFFEYSKNTCFGTTPPVLYVPVRRGIRPA